jgi:intraflagellar transport protein 140
MRFARGAKAAREAEKEKEPEARIAMVAIQLNMIEDAKELYRSCGRYDLLCKLHQACGEWDEAIEVAEKYNRINLKNTHYALAKHFESIGETDNAIRHFVQSNTHRIEVPRMLCGLRDFDRLQAFVQGQREPELFKWWAQYLEAQGMLQESLGFYREAHEWGSVVRLLCMCSDVSNAVKIALETGDAQGAFHLARHYEQNQNIREAIVYYSKSQRLHHAIRMAMEHGFDQEVMTLSLQASKQNMIMSANYFEAKGKHDKAV